jgi:hypothetical protein
MKTGEGMVYSSEQIKKRREMQVKGKVKFTLKQATKTQRRSRIIAVLFP